MTITEQEAAMPGWGGKREGAGRPAGSGEDLVDLDTQVRRDQLDWLDRVKDVAGDRSRAVTVRRLLDEARRMQGIREHLAALARPETGAQILPAQPLARWVLAALDGEDAALNPEE
jgi:hypothetical protein